MRGSVICFARDKTTTIIEEMSSNNGSQKDLYGRKEPELKALMLFFISAGEERSLIEENSYLNTKSNPPKKSFAPHPLASCRSVVDRRGGDRRESAGAVALAAEKTLTSHGELVPKNKRSGLVASSSEGTTAVGGDGGRPGELGPEVFNRSTASPTGWRRRSGGTDR
jgi:hypothetical protein